MVCGHDKPGVARMHNNAMSNNITVVGGWFARTVAFAIGQPEDVDINEILFRPTRQEM